MPKTVDQQNQDTIQAKQDRLAAIQNQREAGSLAELLINDRKNRGVLNKTAGDFAVVNDNLNILSKQLKNGPQTSDAQKVRAFNNQRDKGILAAKNLDAGANIKDEIKADNARLEAQAKAKGITLNELKVALQEQRDDATQEALLDITKELLNVTERAETASVREQKKLLRQTNTQIKILMEVEGQTDPEKSPELAQALETQRLLKENTGILKQTGEVIGDQLLSGLGAMVGVLGDSPALALGAQFIQTKFNERKENKQAEVAAVRAATREKSNREIEGLVDAQGSELDSNVGTTEPQNTTTIVDKTKNFVGDATNTLLGKDDDPQDGVIKAVNRVEDTLKVGNIQALSIFKQQQRDAIEAKRDAEAGGGIQPMTMISDALEAEDLSLFANILSGNFIADRLNSVIKTIFSKKAMMFMLKKALPLAAIGTMLFAGFKAGIDSFNEDGDIAGAIGDGAAAIVEVISFGFLSVDTIKNWGSDLGLAIDDGINLWKIQLENSLAVPIDNLKQFGNNLAEWFSPLTNMSVRDFLPESVTSWMEKAGIIDTREEARAKKLIEDFDADAEAALQARVKGRSLSKAEVEAVRQSIADSLQKRADTSGQTLAELKAGLQERKQQMPTQASVVSSNVIPIATSELGRSKNNNGQLSTANPTNRNIADLQTVIEEKRIIEKRKANAEEAEKRKAQQAVTVHNTQNTQNNNAVNVQAGGPSDDDHMYNRSENQQRVG